VAIAERVVDHRPLPCTRSDTRDGDLHAIRGSLEDLAAVADSSRGAGREWNHAIRGAEWTIQ